MTKSSQPQEPEKTTYQREKIAKEPAATKPPTEVKPKPKPKPRKAFVPKKLIKKSDMPQEYRVRQILVSSLGTANIFRQSIIDYQNELNAEVLEDPDKVFNDREKVENFFSRIAKKYSVCRTSVLGGDLDWIHKGMNVQEEIMTLELIATIVKTDKHVVPETVKTKLGYHIILVCDNRDRIEKDKVKSPIKPKTAPAGTNIPT